jgi:hypothetical protein
MDQAKHDLAAVLALTLCFQGRMRDHKSGPRPPCWFNWLMKGLSKHVDCWIIVLVRRIESAYPVDADTHQG